MVREILRLGAGRFPDTRLQLFDFSNVQVVVGFQAWVDSSVHFVLSDQPGCPVKFSHGSCRHHGQLTFDGFIYAKNVVRNINDASEKVVARCQFSGFEDVPKSKES